MAAEHVYDRLTKGASSTRTRLSQPRFEHTAAEMDLHRLQLLVGIYKYQNLTALVKARSFIIYYTYQQRTCKHRNIYCPNGSHNIYVSLTAISRFWPISLISTYSISGQFCDLDIWVPKSYICHQIWTFYCLPFSSYVYQYG